MTSHELSNRAPGLRRPACDARVSKKSAKWLLPAGAYRNPNR